MKHGTTIDHDSLYAEDARRPTPTPHTDREEYITGPNDVGFRVVNPSLCRKLERQAAEYRTALEAAKTQLDPRSDIFALVLRALAKPLHP